MTLLRCLPLALIGAVIMAAVGSYASMRTNALATHVLTAMNDAVSSPDNAFDALDELLAQATVALRSMWQSPQVWLSIIGTLLVGVGFHGALIAQQSAWLRASTGGAAALPSSAAAWLAVTVRRLPSLLLAIALLALALAAAALLLAAAAEVGVAAAFAVGVLILTVATWLWGRLQLWLVAMFARDLGALRSLRESWQLVRGHWWRVSTLITIAYLIVMLISALATAQLGPSGGQEAGASLPSRLLALACTALTLPMLPAVWLELYRELASPTQAGGAIKKPR
jgi:hypothetical protein